MDDADLIGRIRNGESSLFAVLVRRHQGAVLSLIANLVHDRTQAADLLQDTFFSAYRKLASFDPSRGTLLNWLYAIAKNNSLNHLKRTKVPVDFDFSETPGREDTEGEAARREIFTILDTALAALPVKDRTVFVLAEVRGLNLAEVAAIEGIRLGTVKSRLSRAKDKLRRILKNVLE